MPKLLYLGLDPSQTLQSDVEVIHHPILHIVARPWDALEMYSIFQDWPAYTHLLVTSKQAVALLMGALRFHHIESREHITVIAVGEKTASALKGASWKKIVVSTNERQEGIIELLKKERFNERSYLFFPRSARARPLIEQFFLCRALRHQILSLYDTEESSSPLPENLEEFDEIMFTSPSTVSFFFHKIRTLPQRPKLRAIGEVTWQNLQRAIMIYQTRL